jgi:hypothetical protein
MYRVAGKIDHDYMVTDVSFGTLKVNFKNGYFLIILGVKVSNKLRLNVVLDG